MKTNKNYWRDYWDSIGRENCSDFEADRGTLCVYPDLAERFEKDFMEALNPQENDVIFDAGCGTGVNLKKFSRFAKKMVGIDISRDMIIRAKKRVEYEGLSNVYLGIGSVSDIGLKSNSFDKLICTSVLQYLDDKECEDGILDFFRITKSNGTIILHVKNQASLYGITLFLIKKFAKLIGRAVTPDYYRSISWYEKIVKKLGGEIIDYNSFGVFNISHLPRPIVQKLLKLEMKIKKRGFIKRHGLNCQIIIRIKK